MYNKSGTLAKRKFIKLPENVKKTQETEIESNQNRLIDWTEVIPAECLEETTKFYATIKDYRDDQFKNFDECAIDSSHSFQSQSLFFYIKFEK